MPAMAAVSIYSVEGLSGLGGRLLLGVLADRLGAKPVLVAGLLVQALSRSQPIWSSASSASSMRCRWCSASPTAA